MFKKINNYLKEYKHSLFVVDQKELAGGTKFLLGVFVLTVFVIIGWGLSWQTAPTKSPHQQFGYECKKLINKKEPIKFLEIERDYRLYKKELKYATPFKDFGDDPQCKELGSELVSLFKDSSFKNGLSRLKTLRQKRNQANYQFKRL